jgi:predicted nucleic acid-binding protein
VLRVVFERGMTPELERQVAAADHLVTSRLSMVETERAFLRVRRSADRPEGWIADAERSVEALWRHCEIWELSRDVCDLAGKVAPKGILRSLDALHLATFVLARRALGDVEMLTTDRRLKEAASTL